MERFNSFKSFEKIYRETINSEGQFLDFQKYYAHTHPIKEPENLIEHTTLVVDYTLALINNHHLEIVIHRLLQPLLEVKSISSPEEVGIFVKKIFLSTIIFHDYGKINESFQYYLMNNQNFRPNRANGIGTKHSILSAFLYISSYLNEIYLSEKFNEESKAILYLLTFLFSLSIIKHHSSYIEKEIAFPEELIDALGPYLYKIGVNIEINLIQQFFNGYKVKIKEFSEILPESFYFPLYMLIKLNYSLLTAADYYATTSFKMSLKIEEFGVLQREDIERFVNSFKSAKLYNKEFFEQREVIQNTPHEYLLKCNPQNINILRQKLLDEVITGICQNSEQNIFYLEAPTGSGKTNLSIAAALELLKLNREINKIYYVFPFTTLITQTAKTIQETLELSTEQVIQLHSRSGFTSKREEEQYGSEHLNYIDYLFVNYPITLLTHVKFFDILKSNSKEPTYIFHRLANSIVIIDELQSYPPREWDKIAFFIDQFAYYFNIKFILMSATLPKLSNLKVSEMPLNFYTVVKDKIKYFQNPNFRDRVKFDFSLLEQNLDLDELSNFVVQKCNQYASINSGKVKAIVEFIYKRTASNFYKYIYKQAKADGYDILILSGTILEPRRREIIEFIKSVELKKKHEKILLISTQVVEAGVDIDMDIGFKDKSLIDSDEQLAGRVNRNARPEPATVYIFDLDPAFRIYGDDLRYRITRDFISHEDYVSILSNKDFDYLYEKVYHTTNLENKDEFIQNLSDYQSMIKKLKFSKINSQFKIIDQQSATIYVPLEIPAKYFSNEDLKYLQKIELYSDEADIDGEKVWGFYLNLTQCHTDDFIKKKITLKKLYGIMSQYMFSIHLYSSLLKQLLRFCDNSYYEKYNILYMAAWQDVYDFKTGIMDDKFDETVFI